jgi:hypothetical protein
MVSPGCSWEPTRRGGRPRRRGPGCVRTGCAIRPCGQGFSARSRWSRRSPKGSIASSYGRAAWMCRSSSSRLYSRMARPYSVLASEASSPLGESAQWACVDVSYAGEIYKIRPDEEQLGDLVPAGVVSVEGAPGQFRVTHSMATGWPKSRISAATRGSGNLVWPGAGNAAWSCGPACSGRVGARCGLPRVGDRANRGRRRAPQGDGRRPCG